MDKELHRVTENEVPALLDWLQKHLPDSWVLYGLVRENTRLTWPGYRFFTLGWPDIEAASMDDPDQTCGCLEYYASTRKLALYAPEISEAYRMLTWPGFMDWTKSVEIRIPSYLSTSVQKLVKQPGTQETNEHSFYLMMAQPGDLVERSVPEDMNLRSLKPELHAAIVNSTWQYSRAHSEIYIRQLLCHMPSLGLFDRSGRCLGHVIGADSGTLAILYVLPEMRGRGLASILVSRLAQVYFGLGLPAATYCNVNNEPSVRLHEKIGFRKVSTLNFVYHTPEKTDIEIK